jgi:hypothetical protein
LRTFFPSTTPSMMIFNIFSCRAMFPISCTLLWLIHFRKYLSSPTLFRTHSLVIISFQLIVNNVYRNRLQIQLIFSCISHSLSRFPFCRCQYSTHMSLACVSLHEANVIWSEYAFLLIEGFFSKGNPACDVWYSSQDFE